MRWPSTVLALATLLFAARSLLAAAELTVALAADPRTFCPLFATDQVSAQIADLLHADLIRVHRRKGVASGNLAARWQWSERHRVLEIALDSKRRFSDGSPIRAADAVFSLRAAFDPELAVAAGGVDLVGGTAPEIRAVSEQRLELRFAEPRPGLERVLDSLPVLPRARYQQARQAGEFEAAFGPGVEPKQLVGAGPFVIASYRPGEELVLERNRYYGKRDPAGRRLPYLDRIRFVILPDQETRLLRFQASGLDLLGPLAADDYRILAALEASGRIQRRDLGPSLGVEFLWFNLWPEAAPGQASAAGKGESWFADPRLRQAIDLALDRFALARSVYEGYATAANGPLPPDHPMARAEPAPAADPAAANALLENSGYLDSNHDGVREDRRGAPLRFSLITNAGNSARESAAVFVQADLKRIGLAVEVVPLESRSLLTRVFETGEYETALLGMAGGDRDPTAALAFVRSTASDHWWAPELEQPARPWEAELDRLYDLQGRTMDPTERRELVLRLQTVLAQQRPMIFLVHRHLLLAASRRVGGFEPAPLFDFMLWNADRLWLRERGGSDP